MILYICPVCNETWEAEEIIWEDNSPTCGDSFCGATCRKFEEEDKEI